MKIEVVIPVVQYGLAMDLLTKIDSNSLVPQRVIVIDNTNKSHFWLKPQNFELDFYHSTTGRLNESWEVARSKLSAGTDYVSFLNDDIIIGDWFFQRVIETFEANTNCGIVCPNTVDTPEKVSKGKVRYKTQQRKMFEPQAFTIRKKILDKIPPAPWKRVTTFYGDNWIWKHVKDMGYSWGKDLGNNIYHYVGQSVLQFGFRSIKKSELNEWNRIKRKMNWIDN
jgi:hypothetical protein